MMNKTWLKRNLNLSQWKNFGIDIVLQLLLIFHVLLSLVIYLGLAHILYTLLLAGRNWTLFISRVIWKINYTNCLAIYCGAIK